MTPAVGALINISSRRFDDGIPIDFDFPDSQSVGIALIGPQVIWHSPPIVIEASELENPAIMGDRYLWGSVEYDDIFPGSVRHRTEFCFKIVIERVAPTNELWLSFEPHSLFNAADEDCLRPIDPTA